MDPNANLKEQREIARRILLSEPLDLDGDAARLAELVIALDGWITRGGFLPKDWQR
jgi:hypothetical protein